MTETFAPRKVQASVELPGRVVEVTLREMSVANANIFDDLVRDMDIKTLEAVEREVREAQANGREFDDAAEKRVLIVRTKARAQALKWMLNLPDDVSPSISDEELERQEYSPAVALIAKQQQLNRRSDALGELYGLVDRVMQAARTSSGQPNSASAGSASSTSCASSDSATASATPTE